MRPNQLLPIPAYKGPIFDGDTHISEKDFSMFEKYLPKKYHKDWLIQRKFGPDGEFATYIGERKSDISETNAEGLVPPPGKLKEWLAAVKAGKSTVEGWIKPTPDMYDPQARLAKLDEFGVDGSILFVGNFVGLFGYLDEAEGGIEEQEKCDDTGLDIFLEAELQDNRGLEHPGHGRPQLSDRAPNGVLRDIGERVGSAEI